MRLIVGVTLWRYCIMARKGAGTFGLNVHLARLARMRRIKDESIKELFKAGELVRKDAQDSIRKGAISGAGHIPSAPGEPPNADTHNLDLSIDVRINPSKKSVTVFARAKYAAALELGTARIEARPFLRPALQRNKNRVVYGQVQAIRATTRVFKSDSAFAGARQRYEDSQND